MIWQSGWLWPLLAAFCIWLVRRRAIRAWWHGHRDPEPPVNIRAVYPDNRPDIPLECVYRGFYGDLHHWLVVIPVWYEPGMEIKADALPPRTNLIVPMTGDGAGAGWF